MASHAAEVASAVRTLTAQDFVRPDRLFALTNSEGALHALRHQLSGPELPFTGLVLTAPPGRRVGDVARSQLAAQATAVPNGHALLTLYAEAIERFLAGAPMAPDPALPPGVQQLLQSLTSPIHLPFARELRTADAAQLLARLNVPVLVPVGQRDIQVDWRADGGPLQRAAAHLRDATFLFPACADHVLKHEPRPRASLTAADAASGYNSPESRLDPETVDAILQWLEAHI